jgi:hypothetical protein
MSLLVEEGYSPNCFASLLLPIVLHLARGHNRQRFVFQLRDNVQRHVNPSGDGCRGHNVSFVDPADVLQTRRTQSSTCGFSISAL